MAKPGDWINSKRSDCPTMILGSVLAVCVCCCKGGEPPQWGYNFNWDNYFACIRRCRWATLMLMISLFIIGILVVFYTTGAVPSGVVLTNIVLVAIGAPLFVRAICCAYD